MSKLAQIVERRSSRVIHYTLSYLVHGRQNGTDQAIVLLHDIPAGAFAWEAVMQNLQGLGRAIYAVDLLGFGASEAAWPADTSIWGQADIIALWLKQQGLTNVTLVGHGLGGGVAQILATRLSVGQVAKVVLIDTVCYLQAFAPDWPLPEMEKRQDVDAPHETSLEDFVRDLRATLPKAVYNTKSFINEIDPYLQTWSSENGKEVLYQHIRLSIPSYVNSVATDMKSIEKPVLILWGQEDAQIPVSYAERLHREIPDSQLVVIPQAGHYLPFDAPEAIAEEIRRFI